MSQLIPILTINGSDGAGVVGVQADVRTISALGGYALTAITSVPTISKLFYRNYPNTAPLPINESMVTGHVPHQINGRMSFLLIPLIRFSNTATLVEKTQQTPP